MWEHTTHVGFVPAMGTYLPKSTSSDFFVHAKSQITPNLLNWPCHTPVLEVSVWTPPPSPEDEVATSQKRQWPTTYLLGWSPIDLLYVWSVAPKVFYVETYEKKNQNLTTQNTTRFCCFHPATANCLHRRLCFVCCEILFFYLGINNRPTTYTKFPAKMNSGFWPTTQNLQNQQCCCMGLAKWQGQIQWQVPIRLIRVCSTI